MYARARTHLSRSYLSLHVVSKLLERGEERREEIRGRGGRGEVGRERGLAKDGLVCKIRYLRGDTRDTCFIFMREERRVLAYSKHKLLSAG